MGPAEINMLHKLPLVGRKVTPPQPTFMTDEQKCKCCVTPSSLHPMPARSPPWDSPYSPTSADYLASLRSGRSARPTGSRPPPFKSRTTTDRHVLLRAESALSLRGGAEHDGHISFDETNDTPGNQRSVGTRHSMLSERSMPSLRSTKGRPLAQAPGESIPSMRGRLVSPTATVEPTNKSQEIVYKESGTRWLERQEAHALRQALEVMDAQEEEKKVHQDALDEAADLVWQHQHPAEAEEKKAAGYRNPDLLKKQHFKSHLARGAHERSQSDGYISLGRGNPDGDRLRRVSEASNDSNNANKSIEPVADIPRSKKKRLSDAMQQLRIASSQAIASVDKGALRNLSGGQRRMSGQRYASNNSTVFPNPEDKIYEEAEDISTEEKTMGGPQEEPGPLKPTSRNPIPVAAVPRSSKADMIPVTPKARPNPFDRRRRQAEQPKAVPYTSTEATPPRTTKGPESVLMKDGKEIRSDDIRAATSMKRSDRSPKLPTPTAVSDRAGRPIVSFDPSWRPPSEVAPINQELPTRHRPQLPAVIVSAPVVPTINVPDDDDQHALPKALPEQVHTAVPAICLPDELPPPVPTFNFSGPDAEDDSTPITALPTIVTIAQPAPPARPLPKHTQSLPSAPITTNTSSHLPWLNRGTPTATCASCTLPISGRIVTASSASGTQSARFHPSCFTCAHCATALECVAFYPEPEAKRLERLQRDALDSENDPLRFYCHLDFHEFFSPRCRSCKTPIEGEVIQAAGAEYHVGHFWCAECGDPFDCGKPFVEREGYAYCVGCHRKRTSGRCRGCKSLILDEGAVEALGGMWHEACFVCFECGAGFGEDGRFFVREIEVETTAKERRRGVGTKVAERAVCDGCEAVRLKQ